MRARLPLDPFPGACALLLSLELFRVTAAGIIQDPALRAPGAALAFSGPLHSGREFENYLHVC